MIKLTLALIFSGSTSGEKSRLVANKNSTNDYRKGSFSPSIRSDFKSKSQESTRSKSRFSSESVGRHRLSSFAPSNKGGTISFGINKVKEFTFNTERMTVKLDKPSGNRES